MSLNYGITNFDNVLSAFLTIFQCITMEGWTIIMYIYMDLHETPMVVSYFISCVICCSFFLLNLTIAVMLMEYEQLDKSEDNSSHKEQLRQIGRDSLLPRPLVDFIIVQNNIKVSKKAAAILTD